MNRKIAIQSMNGKQSTINNNSLNARQYGNNATFTS